MINILCIHLYVCYPVTCWGGLGPCAGALLKAAFICAGVVELRSSQSLAEQLSTKYGCGFQLKTVAKVPQGSGELAAGCRV